MVEAQSPHDVSVSGIGISAPLSLSRSRCCIMSNSILTVTVQSSASLHPVSIQTWLVGLYCPWRPLLRMWCKNHTEPRLTSLNPRFVQIFLSPMPVTSRTYQSSHYVPDPAEARRSTILGNQKSKKEQAYFRGKIQKRSNV